MFWRFLGFARRYRWMLVMATGLVFVATGFNLLMPEVIRRLVDRLTVFAGISHNLSASPGNPQLLEQLRESQADTSRWVLWMIVFLAVIYVMRWLITYAQQMTLLVVGNRILFDVRQKLFRHLQRLSLRFYEQNPHGWIMARVLYDVDAVQATLSGSLVDLISNTLLVAGALTILYIYDWQLALIATLALPLYVLNFLGLRRAIRREAQEARDQFSQVYSILSEDIAGVKVVMSFAREQWEARRFVREIRETIRRNVRLGRMRTILSANATLITALCDLVVLGLGSYQMLYHGTMTLGGLIAFRSYLYMLFQPIIELVRVNDVINTAMAAVDRIFETLDTPPDIQEPRNPVKLGRARGEVEFQHVGFSYEPTEPVLQNIDLRAEPGQVIALVGPSGSGKTTLVHLIPRFYDPQMGRILIDGHDLRDVSLRELRHNIGMVMQEDFLFSGSLRENIKYGRPNATDEEVVQAAIAANAHDFIMDFPDGYETQVGERGDRLSGGQRQRISIARAILRNPRILILDEATSDLDSESEALIQEALVTLMKNRTTFTIAHRLSTVMNANEILVMDHGEIVERGTHAELATAGGLYSKLCEVQFRRGQEKIEEHEALLHKSEGEQ
ncbi:MAG: ABC transporter ATP-binding protein [candidate division WS1 bacterium]|nr:ABC transporter ATP-binding protein [candidate division WS1 bacterium]